METGGVGVVLSFLHFPFFFLIIFQSLGIRIAKISYNFDPFRPEFREVGLR